MKILRKLQRESQLFLSTTRKLPCCGFLTLTILVFLLSNTANSQSRWNNYVGVYFTGNAEVYYIGLSISVGSDLHIKKNFSAGFYGQYFGKDFGDHDFQTWTLAALGQVNLGKRKKFYVAIGVAWQRTIENDDANFYAVDRSIITPAYRLGRHFVFKKIVISPEINLTGPHTYGNGSIDIFTLPSIGVRLQFLRNSR